MFDTQAVRFEILRRENPFFAAFDPISTSDEPRAKQKAVKDGSETLIAAKMVQYGSHTYG